jgi:septation ring formation regulator EzrA
MFLNVILALLVILLTIISIGVYFWWKNYGKKMFDMIENLKSLQKPINTGIPPSNINIDEMFKQMNTMFSKFKK